MADRFATRAVHAGEARSHPYGALTVPVVQSSTFLFADSAEVRTFMEAKAAGDRPRDDYGRYGHPTQRAAEAKLAALEGGEQALLFASGMNAITTTLLSLLRCGDHLVLIWDGYHKTREFVLDFLPRFGIEVTARPVETIPSLDGALRPNTRLILAEAPSNPFLRVPDLPALAALARRRGLHLLVDSTFATPVNLRPLEWGAGLVLHSATKYLGGHNDLLAGVVIGARALLPEVEKARGLLGGVLGPQEAYLLLRGLKTLELRLLRQNATGLEVARYLAGHPRVRRVHYPGLESHPDHALARRIMTGFGGVVSFELDGDFAATGRFVDRLRLPGIGPTLGGVESIVQQPAAHLSLDPRERAAAGLPDNLVRLALGIESPEDLIADLQQALRA